MREIHKERQTYDQGRMKNEYEGFVCPMSFMSDRSLISVLK